MWGLKGPSPHRNFCYLSNNIHIYLYTYTYMSTYNGNCHSGPPRNLSKSAPLLAVTEALVAHTIDDNDASGVVSATLMIARFSRSVVSLGLLLPS